MTASNRHAVLLDIDGTLLDSNDAHAASWREVFVRAGHDIAFERVRALVGKGGDKLLHELIGVDDESDEGRRLTDRRRALFMRDYLPALEPTRGARALLQRLRDAGMRRVIASSAGGEELAALLRQAGVDDLVDDAATSSDAAASKPDPDIVAAALRKAGVPAARAVMIGDTPYDIEAARAAAVACIALRCGGWSDEALAGAAAIYDDPQQLLERIDGSPLRA